MVCGEIPQKGGKEPIPETHCETSQVVSRARLARNGKPAFQCGPVVSWGDGVVSITQGDEELHWAAAALTQAPTSEPEHQVGVAQPPQADAL